jgi:MarR family transcriptional regulator, 2-MHQ and catechol-resistance regulon repressor
MVGQNSSLPFELWDKFSRTYDKIKKVQTKHIFEKNLTAPQYGVLETLYKNGPMPLKKISEELMVTGANITCVVDNLEKEEYVKRVHSKDDRRVINAELTEKGKTKVTQIYPEYSNHLMKMISILSEEEQGHFVKMLEKLNA